VSFCFSPRPSFLFILSFDSVSDLLEPVSNGKADNCFISKSYDAASHFEACAEDVLGLCKLVQFYNICELRNI